MKYELLDELNYPLYVIDVDKVSDGKSYADFKIWAVDSWDDTNNDKQIYEKHFVATVYWKYDNCTHWNFYGMDYEPNTPNEDINPGYYHICGSFFMTRWMIMFAFVRKVMNEVLGDKTNDYKEFDKKLDDEILKGYRIREVE